MATRKIKIYGINADVTTEATVLFDGVQVFTGPLNAAIDNGELFGWNFENADDTIESNHTLSIAVTAGSLGTGGCYINCGNNNIPNWAQWTNGEYKVNNSEADISKSPLAEIDGEWYYQPGSVVYGDGSVIAQSERINCLVDGELPGFLTEKTLDDQILPTGVLPDAPTFSGWYFRIDAGSTFTCTVRVPRVTTNTIPGVL